MPKNSNKDDAIYTASIVDKFLGWLKNTAYNNFLETNEKWFTKIGLVLMYFIAAMSLIVSIVIILKYDAVNGGTAFVTGLLGALFTILFQYVAAKTIPSINNLVSNNPTKLSSTAILDVFALMVGIMGVISLFSGLLVSIQSSNFQFFLVGISLFAICEYWLAMALKPSSLNIEIVKDSSAGEEFIALLTFFAKGSLKIIPIIFCGCMIFVSYKLIAMMFEQYFYISEIDFQVEMLCYGLCGALLPLLGYFSFIGYYFTIDIARAILSLPRKIDKK